MKLGDIYVWTTDQAIGYAQRRKYHMYVGDAGWRQSGHAFLFISKADYGGDYLITKNDYPFFPLEQSYVSCGNIVVYADADLDNFNPEYCGRLSKAHMIELRDVVSVSEVMEQWQINLVCNCLAAAHQLPG